jgi:high affinity Mn2+ porin
MLKKTLIVILSLIGCLSYSQTTVKDTVAKKTVKEFEFADSDKDGLITNHELQTVINDVFDRKTPYSSLDVYRLTLYFKNQYLPAEQAGMITAIEEVKPTQDSIQETDNRTFFEKYFAVNAEITALYQYSAKLKKATYDGPISLSAKAHDEKLVLITLPVIITPWKGAEFNFTPEYAGGNGVGNGAGVAAYPGALYGYPGGDPYFLRAQYKQAFETDTAKKSKLKGFNFTLGQFILQEMFSGNPYSGNPKKDFLNFSHTMLNAWDAATTAYGYTYGMASSFLFKRSSLNMALVTVNKEAGGPLPDWNVGKGYSINLQYAQEYVLFNKQGTIRALGFMNSTKSGVYKKFEYDSLTASAFFSDSLKSYQQKIGFGIDADMAINENLGLFARYSWNDGKSESWGYTQCDGSFNAGLAYKLGKLRRPNDAFGLCGSYNTISKDHQKFLKNGGSGFMIGDGTLTYAPEIVGEVYYTTNVFEHCFLTLNYQYLMNPAYNSERGAANFIGGRFHFEF